MDNRPPSRPNASSIANRLRRPGQLAIPSQVTRPQTRPSGPQAPQVRDDMLRPRRPLSTPSPTITSQARTVLEKYVPRPSVLSARPVEVPLEPPLPPKKRQASASTDAKSASTGIWRRIADIGQYPLFAGIAVLAAYSSTIGQWFILVYAVYVLIRRLRSRISFAIALFLLLSIPVFQVLHQGGVAQTIAIYAYELLVVGTVQAIIEMYLLRKSPRPDLKDV